MGLQENINNNDERYWQGKGRQLLIVPRDVIRWYVLNDDLFNPFYITGLGFYPAADLHYSFREKGSADMIIIICISGRGTYETSEGTFTVLPGQFFILSAHEWHSYRADKEDPWSIYWVCLAGPHVPEFCARPEVRKCFIPAEVDDLWQVTTIFNTIYQTLEVGYSLNRLIFCSLILNHFLGLLCYTPDEIKDKAPSLAHKVIKFMEERLTANFSLEELASHFNYSPSQFSHLFKKETKLSPMNYFIRLKLRQSCKLLKDTDKRIFEVAQELGYKDQYHFSKLFKKIMSLSPEQYRASRREKED